ncbi:MAG: hypothetical protein VX619_00675 [bacterium]|nr:hypothetical protein [bacterium]
MKRLFLYKITKTGTGSVPVWSSSLVDEEQANKLHFIFHNYAGQKSDFMVFLDEFDTTQVPLSHIDTSATLLAPMEINVLRKHGLDRVGIMSPLDLLEEFESLMGDILLDEDEGQYYLEGEKDEPEDLADENYEEEMVHIPRSTGKGSIII